MGKVETVCRVDLSEGVVRVKANGEPWDWRIVDSSDDARPMWPGPCLTSCEKLSAGDCGETVGATRK